ncbi:MAG: RNA ligase (ATP) [Stutzerimonas stutzeri]|nr:MAG: RNA ligase (ATP) [Stutzerimonas stutzeri]
MSTFEVWVRKIEDVREHPKADRLSIVKVLGYEAIVNKLADGSPRYKVGDLVVYVPEQSIIPDEVLKAYGFWREESTREDGTIKEAGGMLAGKRGNRVKIANLRGVASQGLIFPLTSGHITLGSMRRVVREGEDVAAFFGITKYEPPIPQAMDGEIAGVPEMSFLYDIENWQNFPGFLDNDEVVAVEKCHGTNFRICYHPQVRDVELFGTLGQVGIASKSLGAEGKMFKRNRVNLGDKLWGPSPEELADDRRLARIYWWQTRPGVPWLLKKLFNKRPKKPRSYAKSNLYVRVAIEQGLIEKVEALGQKLGKRIDLFGEVFGAGVQKLDYGQKTATFRAFDIAVDRQFMDEAAKQNLFAELGVERLPVLYHGPWNEAELIKHRDGKTMISGTNIREGIVVTAVGDQTKRETPDGVHRLRPFLKMVSPDYLKTEDGSEIQ